jgi:cell division protein FtsL
MTRLTLVLLVATTLTALYLVHTQYESRRLYVELEKALAQGRKLEVDNDRLQVEKRSQATPLRVEKLARERLQMRTATPAITQYVSQKDQALRPVAP